MHLSTLHLVFLARAFPDFFLNEFSVTVKPPSTLLPRQANVTQAQFEAIAVASITELWTNFGK